MEVIKACDNQIYCAVMSFFYLSLEFLKLFWRINPEHWQLFRWEASLFRPLSSLLPRWNTSCPENSLGNEACHGDGEAIWDVCSLMSLEYSLNTLQCPAKCVFFFTPEKHSSTGVSPLLVTLGVILNLHLAAWSASSASFHLLVLILTNPNLGAT